MRTLPPRILPVVVAISLMGLVDHAHAGPREDAQAHFEAAAELYAKEDYEAATREFALAYALDPRLDVLFAWAQAERLAGDWVDAHRLFARLLARDDLSEAQRGVIVELDAEVRAAADADGVDVDAVEVDGEAPTDPERVDLAPSGEPALDEPVDDRGEPRRRKLGVALTTTDGVFVAGGVGLVVGGLLIDRNVADAASYAEFDQRYDPASGRGRGSIALYSAGGVIGGVGLAVLIAGAVTLARAKSSRPPAKLAISADAAGLRVQW